MENQHRKIKGYRDLSQEEIDLMNRIKAKGSELLELQAELMCRLNTDLSIKNGQIGTYESYYNLAPNDATAYKVFNEAKDELARFKAAEPQRWAAIGKTDIETGIMALVRSIAQPAPF
ncbi:Acb2/Tad1 domain-containing protein [Aquirhabdus parva]|uniref:Acb2/Tad1 hairpin domain-containing protein n=1 Tax=Aquirhabdus parva TaxID=2283318 RepID=A0A345PAQ4_9GAMM|nr:hypothetical protein [Aquirhabdus parva]AXI04363.1 hypothetical protein HYN46_16885 [Aquirhabdus parva]AXI04407.1 hypothetical protein HYN46_17130 [Aquirhabdus parva]